MMEKLIDFINELSIKCDEEYKEIQAKAYNVKLESNYATTLRDEFSKNSGKQEIIAKIKVKMLEMLNEEEGTSNK